MTLHAPFGAFAPLGALCFRQAFAKAWHVTTTTRLSLAPSAPWSGIDAGRREQVDLAASSRRYFRRTRRILRSNTVPIFHSVELRGDAAKLRELRSAEMKAWEQSGGDFYRPERPAA